jgi:hypothetical protein
MKSQTVFQSVQKFPAFYWPRRFITVFKTASHISLLWAKSIQSMALSNFLNIYFNIIIPSAIGSSKCFFHSRFPPQKRCMNLFSPSTCYMSRQTNSSWFDRPNNISWGEEITKFFVMQSSLLLCYLLFLRPVFLNFLCIRFSLNITNKISRS